MNFIVDNPVAHVIGIAVSAVGQQIGTTLEHLGLKNDTLKRYATTLIQGTLIGFATGGVGGAISFGTSSLLNLRVNELALHLGLSPPIANTLSLVAGTLAGSIADPSSLPSALQTLVPTLVQELAISGINKLGDVLGMNPILTSFLSFPIGAAFGGFFDSLIYAGHLNGSSFLAAIKNGLVLGNASLHLNVGGNASILRSITSTSLLSSIGNSIMNGDIFSQFFGLAKEIVLSPAKLLGNLSSGVKSFWAVIQEKGLGGALESLATSIFSRQTLSTIFNAGGMEGFLDDEQRDVILPTGVPAKELKMGDGASLFFDLGGKLIGIKENETYRIGEFGIDESGKFGLISGKIFTTLQGQSLEAGVFDGALSDFRGNIEGVEIEGQSDGGIFIPGTESGSGAANIVGNFFTGLIKVAGGAIAYAFNSGALEQIILGPPAQASAIPITDPGNLTNTLLDALRLAGKLTSEKAQEVKEGFKWLVHYTDSDGFNGIIDGGIIEPRGVENAVFFSKEIPTSEPAAREIAMKLQLSYQGSPKINPEKAQYFILIDAEDLTADEERRVEKTGLLDPDDQPQSSDQPLGYEYLFHQPVQIVQRLIYAGYNNLVNWGGAIKRMLDHFLNKASKP